MNLIGSFLIGVVMHVSLKSALISEALRLFLVAGVFGGFTAYSSFSYETVTLYQQGSHGLALLNAGATLLACFIATSVGLISAHVFLSR